MSKSGVLVHCPSRLSAAATLLVGELQCGHGVLTDWAPEDGKAIHHFDAVVSHTFNYNCLSRRDSELKFPMASEMAGARARQMGPAVR
jgi:hypothetical protein